MGTIYYVGCHDCKVTRNLDKFYSARPVKDRNEARALTEQLVQGRDSFCAALLVSFMAEHQLHKCTLFHDYDEELCDALGVYSDDTHEMNNSDDSFWIVEEGELDRR